MFADKSEKVHNIIRTKQPILGTSASFYFEAKILDSGENDIIGIGITQADSRSRSGVFPGWNTYPTLGIGYHGDDGGIFQGSGKKADTTEKFSTGDVVGCFVYHTQISKKDVTMVRFTKNGKKLNFPRILENKVWYPTIGIASPGASVETNFGENQFAYSPEGKY